MNEYNLSQCSCKLFKYATSSTASRIPNSRPWQAQCQIMALRKSSRNSFSTPDFCPNITGAPSYKIISNFVLGIP